MSNHFYDDQWRNVQTILKDTTYSDNIQVSNKSSKDKTRLYKQVSLIFVKYLICINKLGECYDLMVHPQKRQLVRKILDCSIIRYLELKQELVNLSFSDLTYIDEAADELGLLPEEIELHIPECYVRERNSDIEQKNDFLSSTLSKVTNKLMEETELRMTEKEAILLIQRHERARQCRVRALSMKDIRETKGIKKDRQYDDISDAERNSALKIQQIWRAFTTRRKIRQRVIEEMLLIGMRQPDSYSYEERKQADEMKFQRYEIQDKHEMQYQAISIYEQEEIKKYYGNIISDGIRDEMRNWYIMYKQQTGAFPTVPSEDHGGSRVLIGRQSPVPLVGSNSGSLSTTGMSTDSKSNRSKKSKNFQEGMKKRLSDDDFSGGKLSMSNILPELEAANAEYEEIWKDIDESHNPEQNYDLKLVKIQKKAEVESELRKVIDNQIRAELEILQAALERDERGKRIKRLSRKKTRRCGKRTKRKKDKDLTPDRSTESLFEELIENGIIRNYSHTPLSSFTGEISCVGHHQQSSGKECMPSLGDMRQIVKEYCVLPMCSLNIHQLAPVNRSVLIAGPKHCGKKMLVHAICTELGAVLFDLSAANIVGKYPGKAGLVMLVHLINKVTKLLQPSIIYIDEAEKTFLKKVSKTDKTDPKRLKKDLSKIVKSIGPTDLVMLIGTTHAPWDCDQKSLTLTYNKILFMLRPDYASVNMLWSELLISYNAFNRDIDLCTLTKLCDGYTVGTIIKAMHKLMTCKRKLQLKVKPLEITEVLQTLSQFEPVYKEEEEAFLQWYMKIPIEKNRQKLIATEAQSFDDVEHNRSIKRGKKM